MSWTLSAFADEAGQTADEQIAALRGASIPCVDLRAIDGFSCIDLPVDGAESIRKKLADAEIRVAMFGSPIGKIDIDDDFETDRNRLRHLASLKDVFECNAVRIFSYYNKAARHLDEWAQVSLSRLRELRNEAGELGLVLYHENEREIFGDRLPEVHRIAEELRDAETFRMIFDFDNFNQSGDDVWANWEALRDQTDAFHLKDSDAANQHVPVGLGTGQVRPILEDAVARGWSGPVSLEPHLAHSPAVLATGASGTANQALEDLDDAACFQLAAEAARKLLEQISAPVSFS